MIIASLVESEANRDEDRGKVARVIYNRLETDATNGLLQIDATVNYALGRDLGLGLTDARTSRSTRRTTPAATPGCRRGRSSRPATRPSRPRPNPTEGDWVYYVTVDLDTGETKFTDEQNAKQKNVLRYACGDSLLHFASWIPHFCISHFASTRIKPTANPIV